MICDALFCYPEWFLGGFIGFSLATVIFGIMMNYKIRRIKELESTLLTGESK